MKVTATAPYLVSSALVLSVVPSGQAEPWKAELPNRSVSVSDFETPEVNHAKAMSLVVQEMPIRPFDWDELDKVDETPPPPPMEIVKAITVRRGKISPMPIRSFDWDLIDGLDEE